MIDFSNIYSELTDPDYYYIVTEYVTTFGKDKGKTEPYNHVEEFKGSDLKECRELAKKYYWERFLGFQSKKYFLPFESPEDFIEGENAAFSITLSLVEYYNDSNYYEHIILGEDDTQEAREFEKYVFKNRNLGSASDYNWDTIK